MKNRKENRKFRLSKMTQFNKKFKNNRILELTNFELSIRIFDYLYEYSL